MDPKPYPPQKQEQLAALDQRELEAFLNTIPQRHLAEVSHELPRIDGFRPGAPATIQEQVRRVIKNLKGPQGTRAFREAIYGFEKLWVTWVVGHKELNEALKTYDNKQDFADGELKPPNTPLDMGCFDVLVKASQDGRLSREEITQFYKFGYFLSDTAIEEKIAKAPSRQEAESAREAREMPQTIMKLKEAVHALEGRSEEDHRSIESLKGQLKVGAESLASVKDLLQTLQAVVKDHPTKAGFSAAEEKVRGLIDSLGAATRKIEAIKRDAKSTTKDLKEVERRIKDDVESKLGSLKVTTKDLEELERRILNDVESKLGAPKERLANPSATTIPADPAIPHARHAIQSSALGIPNSTFTSIDTPEKCVSVLTDSFSSAGLAVTAARSLSREIVAATLSGQIPMFTGSGASIIAEIAAIAVCGTRGRKLSIPVGLLSGSELELTIESALQATRDQEDVAVLLLEGLNRSAVEAYGHYLSRLVANRLLGFGRQERSLLILGSHVDGPSAIPLSPEITELGPLLNTDVLPWAGTGEPGKVLSGRILKKGWETVITRPSEIRVDRTHFDECKQAMGGAPSLLWQRGLEQAYKQLSMMGQPGGSFGPLQSLVFGWLIPRAYITGVPKNRFEKVLADGKLDAKAPDPRITKLLALLWPESRGSL